MAGNHCMSSESARSSPIWTHSLPVNSSYRDMNAFFVCLRCIPWRSSHPAASSVFRICPAISPSFFRCCIFNIFTRSTCLLARVFLCCFCSCLRNSLSLVEGSIFLGASISLRIFSSLTNQCLALSSLFGILYIMFPL